jgi:diguanylate cyclase (GGDEF)-like protein
MLLVDNINLGMRRASVMPFIAYAYRDNQTVGLRFGYDFILMELDIQSAYLLMVDADDFKSINDSYGHLIGDQVLCKIANTLLKNFRANDYVCRIGGDEFVVIMIGATTKLKPLIRSKIEKINDELCDTSDGVPPISVSVGVTHGSEAADAADLLKIADRAMYELKQHGKHGYYFSDELSGLRHSSTPES